VTPTLGIIKSRE